MTLDLHEVVGVPGLSLAFDYAPDLTPLLDGAYVAVSGTPNAKGAVYNAAGALSFKAHVTAELTVQCSRCLKEFTYTLERDIFAALSESEIALDDPELYHIADMRIDADEILVTELLLDMESNPVCRDDCKGLCPDCGADLNDGDCGCKRAVDPRLAALAQLLEENE